MLLNEIFDTDLNIQPSDWQQSGRFLLVGFKINNQGYSIQLEQKPIEGIDNAVELSFFRNDVEDSEAAFSTTDEQNSPTKVYGIVANAVLPMIKQFDAILIVADRRHSDSEEQFQSKIRIYNSLVQGIQRRKGYRLYTIPDQYIRNKMYTSWLLSKRSPGQNSPYKDEQKIALENSLKYGKVFK